MKQVTYAKLFGLLCYGGIVLIVAGLIGGVSGIGDRIAVIVAMFGMLCVILSFGVIVLGSRALAQKLEKDPLEIEDADD